MPGNSRSGEKVPPSASRTIIDPSEMTPLVVKATKEKLTNELLYAVGPLEGRNAARKLYAFNLNFFTFPLLVEETYDALDIENPRLRREMPFCAFNHVMTGLLNTTIINHVQEVNQEAIFVNESLDAIFIKLGTLKI